MKIHVIRHAWAGESRDPRWPDDRQRPLSDEGRKRFKQYAKRLVAIGIQPAVIATSPLVRCRQTADILAARVPGAPPVVELPALQPDSHLLEALRWTAEQGGADVAWVGHAPDVGALVARLIGAGDAAIHFAKGACAEVRIEPPLEPGRGELLWLATAKVLEK
jgi:phosphohistidine phosphatase